MIDRNSVIPRPTARSHTPRTTAQTAAKGWVQHAAAGCSSPESLLLYAGGAAVQEYAVWRRQEQLRRDGYRHMIGLLAADQRLRPDLEIEHVTDMLMFIAGPDSYQILVNDYGLTTEHWKTWTTETVAQQLLATTQNPRRPRRG